MVFVELYPVVVATLEKTVVREKDTRLLWQYCDNANY
jgi:hypothetical protein